MLHPTRITVLTFSPHFGKCCLLSHLLVYLKALTLNKIIFKRNSDLILLWKQKLYMNPDQTATLGPFCLQYRLAKSLSRRESR